MILSHPTLGHSGNLVGDSAAKDVPSHHLNPVSHPVDLGAPSPLGLLHHGPSVTLISVSLPGADFGQPQWLWGHFRGSLRAFCAGFGSEESAPRCPQKPKYLFIAFLGNQKMEKQNGEAAPQGTISRQQIVPAAGTSKAPVTEPWERCESERMQRQERDFGISDGLSDILSAPTLPHCSSSVCITSFV